MCSRPFETRSFPNSLAASSQFYLLRRFSQKLHSISRFSHLCRAPSGGSIRSLLPSQLCLDHSHCLVLAPATLAALPSTRAIETRSLPTSLAAPHRGFAFYVASPKSSIPSIATCSMSLIPFAPFAHILWRFLHFNGRQSCIVSRL